MRLAIAEHMHSSVTTAPHVTAVFEADFTAIMRHRDRNKAQLAASGINLSYPAYIVAACVAAMKAVAHHTSPPVGMALSGIFGSISLVAWICVIVRCIYPGQ